MFFEQMRRYVIPLFAVGASLIVGFLSFSGMYVLVPVLALAIVGFFLSVSFEYEIISENIIGAFEKLFNPNYLKQQLANECLRELLPELEEKERLKLEMIESLSKIIRELDDTKADNNEALRVKYKHFLNKYQDFIAKENPKRVKELNANVLTLDEFSHFSNLDFNRLNTQKSKLEALRATTKNLKSPKFAAANLNVEMLRVERAQVTRCLQNLVFELKNDNSPDFFQDYMKLIRIHHKYDHPNLTKEQQKEKEQLEKSISALKSLFVSQLFDEKKAPSKARLGTKELNVIEVISSKKELRARRSLFTVPTYVLLQEEGILLKTDPAEKKFKRVSKASLDELRKNLSKEDSTYLDTVIYKASLRDYLNKHHDTWQTKLKKRQVAFRLTQILSATAALFMMLGTSYLLVEAFAVLPFVSLIPFGFWPALVIPMAFIAGMAFGLLTYNAITDMINDDIILKRYRKMKEDWNNGLTLHSGFMLVATVGLLALSIALTICTAGTWWTVLKHTRPLFSWMAKIPSAIVVIAAAILGAAGLAFNVANTLETLEELDEEPGPHPCDLILLSIDEDQPLPGLSETPRLIKKGDQYWMDGCYDGKRWIRTEFKPHSFDHVNFKKGILHYNLSNIQPYLTIKWNRAHTFFPSKRNSWQRANPFRILLILTYTPLRLVLFLGHLISIGVVSDRLPGIPEVLSAILGIIAEFFEDLHYFFSFKHAHKDDIGSLLDEYNNAKKGHNHADDAPTRVLRSLFYPLIYLAAWWDSAMGDSKAGPLRAYADIWVEPSFSFDEALDEQLGKKPQVAILLEEDELAYVDAAKDISVEESTDMPTAKPVPLVEAEENLVAYFAAKAKERTPAAKELIKYSIFKRCCEAPHTPPFPKQVERVAEAQIPMEPSIDVGLWECQPCTVSPLSQ